MRSKQHYSQELLRKSRDAEYLKASRVKLKEYYETVDVYKKGILYVLEKSGLTRFNTIYDFCGSHGFNTPYTITRNKAKYGVSIDLHPSKASRRLWSYYNKQSARMIYKQEDIYRTKYNLSDNSLVVAIHPCGNLAHRTVEIAIENNLPIVISPCCIGKLNDSLISKFETIPKYTKWCISVTEPLYNAGYDINIRSIRESVTPVNTIIIGVPDSKL